MDYLLFFGIITVCCCAGVRELLAPRSWGWVERAYERDAKEDLRAAMRWTTAEWTDHMIPLDEAHLRKILGRFVSYDNTPRCHQSLDGNAPDPPSVEDGDGSVYADPHIDGLHHEYGRAG